MSTTTAGPAADAPATAPDDAGASAPGTPRPRWRRFLSRRTAVYAGVVALGVVLLSLLALSAQRPTAPLDPEGVGPEGARALAQVLRDQGVEVDVVRSIAGLETARVDRSTTVLVADTTTLGPGAALRTSGAVRSAGRLVLVSPTTSQLRRLEVPLTAFPGGTDELPARCDSPLARDDDSVGPSETRFLVQPAARGAVSCFPLPGPDGEDDPEGSGVAMVEVPAAAAHPHTVAVGFGTAWANETITTTSNAGVALRVLGSTPRLVWYQPGQADLTAAGPGEEGGSADVWPTWTGPAIALLGVVIVLLALARGRRLGRLVREPLPVVVRAVETTESRGRLYRRSGDRARAAEVLRAAARDRLGRRLAVPRAAGALPLVHAVASAGQTPAGHVGEVLFGPAPASDTDLIQLAQQLTDLEERVRHP